MTATFFPVLTSDDPPAAPAGWKWRLLGDVARLESGHTPSRREPSYWEGGNIPWLSLKDIRGLAGRYVVETQDMPAQKGIDNSSARVLPKGTVAFCRTASVGKVAILGRDMATSQDFANWVCGPDLLPEYLYEALKASSGQFDKEKQGSTHKTIYMPVLERFRVLLPPLAEQRRIADILDKADAIRRKRKEAIALTEELLRSAFLEMFGDPVTNPKGWPVRTAADVCGSFGGALQTGPFGSQLHASDYTEEGVPVVMPQDLVDGGISTARVARVSAEHVARLDRHKLELGDVVFSRRGDVARFAVVENHQVGWLCGTGCLRIRFATAPLTAAFLRGELGHPSKREWLESEAKGTTMPNLNTSILGKLSIRMPPRGVQEAFEQIAQRVRAMRSEQLDSSTEAGHLFNSLVARAFSGALSS